MAKNSLFLKLIPILLFTTTFIVYSFTACRTNPGFADSDEIITISHLLGVAHPPGYPLQIVITKLFTLLPIPGSIAFKANLTSAFLHSLTTTVLYLIFSKLLIILDKKSLNSSLLKYAIPITGSLLLAFSGPFWLYASVAEVFALNNLLITLTIYSALTWFQISTQNLQKSFSKNEIKWLLLTAFLAGLGLSHVQTFVLLFPGLIIFLFHTLYKYKLFSRYHFPIFPLIILTIILSFILPNLLLFWLNSRQVRVSWFFQNNLSQWFKLITRQDYTGYNLEAGQNYAPYINSINIFQNFPGLIFYLKSLFQYFTPISPLLAILGFIYLYKNQKNLFVFILSLLLTTGFILPIFIGLPQTIQPDYQTLLGIIIRQYTPSFTIFAIIQGIGLISLINYLKKISQNKYHSITTTSILLILVLFSIISNFKLANQRNNNYAQNYSREVLESVKPNSIIICFFDFSCMSLIHAQQVEGLRKDVIILSQSPKINQNFLSKNPHLKGFSYEENPFYVTDIISWNIDKHPVYLTDAIQMYIKTLGVEGNPFFLIPSKYIYEVVKTIPKDLPQIDYQLSEKALNNNPPALNYLQKGNKEYLSFFHTMASFIYAQLGKNDMATKNIQLALQLKSDYQLAQIVQSQILVGIIDKNENVYAKNQPQNSQKLEDLADNYLKTQDIKNAVDLYFKATLANPQNTNARLKLAHIYEQYGFYYQSKREYDHVLKIDSTNSQAQTQSHILTQTLKTTPIKYLTP
jgi:tetratricopeptide (TPR) repeat protein